MDISQYSGQSFLSAKTTSASAGGTRISPSTQALRESTQTSKTASETGGLFEQLVDTVNPLQHIPGIGSMYREATGDTMNPLSAMAGGFLFGGPVGLAAGAASSFLEMLTGKSLLGHAQALLSGEDAQTDGELTAVAQAQPHINAQSQSSSAPDGLSVQQYQHFADAANAIHTGIGADARNVAWADNVWTQRALMQATGQYENTQHLGGSEKNRTQRLI